MLGKGNVLRGRIMIFTKILLKSSWTGLHSPSLPSLRVLRALRRAAFCRNLPTSAPGQFSGSLCLIYACTGPAYIYQSTHAYSGAQVFHWPIAKPEKSNNVLRRHLPRIDTKMVQKRGVQKMSFLGNQWSFYCRKCTFYGRKCTFYGLSTVCLRSLSVASNELNKFRLYDST